MSIFENKEQSLHIAFFYDSDESWRSGIIPLIRDALKAEKKVIYLYDEKTPNYIKEALKNQFNKENRQEEQIYFLKAEDVYIQNNQFDPAVMIEKLISNTKRAISEGHDSLFVTGEMTWALKGIKGSERLIEYESIINKEFFEDYNCIGICQYNLNKFPPGLILDLFTTHPYILYRDVITKNNLYLKDWNLKNNLNRKLIDKILNSMLVEEELEARIKELGKIIKDQPHIGFAILTDFPIKIILINRGFEEILGFRENDCDFLNQIYEQDRKIFTEEYNLVLKGEKQKVLQNIRFVRKSGDLISLRIVMNPVYFMKSKCVELCFVDITEHWIKEEEMNRLREQFLLSQRMESIGRLAAGIAHDFNNMLTAIKGFTQLAQMKIGQEDPVKQYLNNVQIASEKATTLVKQLLAFARKQLIEPKVINLNDLIRNMSELIIRMIGEDIILYTELEPNLGLVEVDPSQMEQVIINLVVNSRDAMPKGGKILIETKNVYIDDDYIRTHHDFKKGPHVMLAISDTGTGIPEEIRDKIFEPFFSTKKEKGTGLGLSTVYGIVKQHGGNISFYSEINRGTTFKIYLPRIDKALEQTSFTHSLDILKGSETILVIDDDDNVKDVLKEMLEKLGYKVLEAKDCKSALSISESYEGKIDLVISDVIMPEISGPELFNKIKQRRPHVKVLYMSGYTENIIAHHGIIEKDISFIQKPFNLELISKKIRDILDRK